jgi:transposase-like protein
LAQLNKRFGTEGACLQYLASLRWPNGVRCPRCDSERVYTLAKPFRWQCKQCAKNGYRFSPLVGTIFENTNYPLTTWFQVIYLMCQSKKGMSALQIHRIIGSGSYRTAWYMCHRIRSAMENTDFQQLMGVDEIDETYIGGDNRNRHANDRKERARPASAASMAS